MTVILEFFSLFVISIIFYFDLRYALSFSCFWKITEPQDSWVRKEDINARLVCITCQVKGHGVAFSDRHYGSWCLFLQIWICKWSSCDGLSFCRKIAVWLISEIAGYSDSLCTTQTRAEEKVRRESGFLQPWYVRVHFIHIWESNRCKYWMLYHCCAFPGHETRHTHCSLAGLKRRADCVLLHRYWNEPW